MNIRELADEARIPLIFESECGARAIYESDFVRVEGMMALEEFREFMRKVKEALYVDDRG